MATKILKKNSSSLMQKLLANSPTKNAAIMSESVFFNDRDIVPIDYPIFNIAFSGSLEGGMSNGLTVFAGVSGVYKTLAALICAKAYMNKYEDAICVLLFILEVGISSKIFLTFSAQSRSNKYYSNATLKEWGMGQHIGWRGEFIRIYWYR